MLKQLFIILNIALLAVASGCTKRTAAPDAGDEAQAQLLHMEQGKGYLKATISDPWHGGQVLHTYILVPADSALPAQLPKGTVVRTPIKRALVYSEVHASVMRELGSYDALKGVCDANYYTDPQVIADVKAGRIADCGSSMSPTIERVIAMKPDAILLSPYQDATYGQVTKLGVPIIECADYMEYTPLGRAEWVRFYGALLGKQQEAEAFYQGVKARYNKVKATASKAKTSPTVITEMVISGVWSVPGGRSYMAQVIKDAGGSYPWADDQSTGSLSLDFNQVLAKAQQADLWLIKWTSIGTLADLKAQYALNGEFQAFKQKKVWVCDTERSHFFVRAPFHPDLLLQDFAAILHPELFQGVKPEFYYHLDK